MELTDILEILYRVAELKGITRSELETLREKKKADRGGFSENLLLIEAEA
jgi:predicted house-cleaning noncanonical NTP pyrophosphatase (MazG superfamily)